MGKIFLTNLSIKITPVKHIKKETSTKVIKTLVKGVVIDKDGSYKCAVKLDSKTVEFDFTKDSFNLYGKLSIFSKTKDKTGHYLRIIRTKEQANQSFGLSEAYVPFRPDWIVNGYIVKEDGIEKFKFNDLVAVNGHEYDRGINYE